MNTAQRRKVPYVSLLLAPWTVSLSSSRNRGAGSLGTGMELALTHHTFRTTTPAPSNT